MAWRIEKGDFLARLNLHLIGTNMLGYTTSFARRDIGLAQGIQQRGFAVINMPHHGNHRGAELQIFDRLVFNLQAGFHIGFRDPAGPVAEFRGNQFGGVRFDCLIDRRHDAKRHQLLDHIDGALSHPVGKLLNRDHVWNDDLTDTLLIAHFTARTVLFPFTGTADRSERPHPFGARVIQRLRNCQLAGVATAGFVPPTGWGRRFLGCIAAAAINRPTAIALIVLSSGCRCRCR